MVVTAERPRADTSITMRIPERTRDLIDAAASALGKSRTEFMIESAREHATNALLDQRMFVLDDLQTQELAEALARPPRPAETLRALMSGKAPWE